MKFIHSILFFLFLVTIQTAMISQDNISGTWLAEDLDHSVINIYKENDGLYYAKITESENKAYINKIVLKEMKYNPKDKVWKGTIYSPKRNMEIDGTISLDSNEKMKLVGKKYFMTKTFYWTRQ